MRFALAGRAAKRLLVLAAVVVVLGAAVLWALPEVVRRVAVDQTAKTLGRQVSIDDVDLNLFSRHLAVKKLRVAEAEGPEAFVAFDRLDVYFSYWPLVHSDVRLREIALDGLAVRAARTDAARFSFSDILDRMARAAQEHPAPPKPPAPSKWTVTIDRVNVSRASIAAQRPARGAARRVADRRARGPRGPDHHPPGPWAPAPASRWRPGSTASRP